jgi:hypothetical protein
MSLEQTVPFLPEDAEILVRVSPSPSVSKKIRDNLARIGGPLSTHAASIRLVEPLKIRFSLSSTWAPHQDLVPCKCVIDVGNDKQEELKSINSAYQRISELVESERRSRGGSVYQKLLAKWNGKWELLARIREDVYSPHRSRYDAAIRDFYEGLPTQPLPRISSALGRHTDKIRELATLEDNVALAEGVTKEVRKSAFEVYEERIKRFATALKDPTYRADEAFWQHRVHQDVWMFAAQHAPPLPKQRVGFDSIPDFLFPTADGYIDVMEIKTPATSLLVEDKGHPGSFRWSKEASEGIGQVSNYLFLVEEHRREIAERLEAKYGGGLRVIRPRGFLLIGEYDERNTHQRDALRRLNAELSRLYVITFTELLQRARSLLKVFQEDSNLRP